MTMDLVQLIGQKDALERLCFLFEVPIPQSPPGDNAYMCILTKFEDDICRDYFP